MTLYKSFTVKDGNELLLVLEIPLFTSQVITSLDLLVITSFLSSSSLVSTTFTFIFGISVSFNLKLAIIILLK